MSLLDDKLKEIRRVLEHKIDREILAKFAAGASAFDGVPPDERPLCAVCSQKVKVWRGTYDMQREEFIYVAECHGDREETRISYTEHRRGAKLVGKCFAPRSLESGARR